MKCKVKECGKRAAEIVGTCKYCRGEYCLNHRLVEWKLVDNKHCPKIQMFF